MKKKESLWCCRDNSLNSDLMADIHRDEMLKMTPVKIIKPGDR